MLSVFLCHSSQDKERVRELYDKLADDGLSPWLDEKAILPGQDWNFEIRNAIQNAHAVIVCLSNNSINKVGYIQKEIRIALDIADEQPEGVVFLIPARLEECNVPQRLSHLQYADLFKNEYEKLLQVLQIRASKLGIRVSKRKRDSNDFLSLKKDTDEEERLKLFSEKFSLAFERLFSKSERKFSPKLANRLNISLVGTRRVGKTAMIYTLAVPELDFLSKTSFVNTDDYQAITAGDGIYINELNVSPPDLQSVSKELLFSDFVFYVLSPDHPLTRFDRAMINIIKQEQIPYIALINKADILKVFYLNDYLSTIEDETDSICVCYSVLSYSNLELMRGFLTRVRNEIYR